MAQNVLNFMQYLKIVEKCKPPPRPPRQDSAPFLRGLIQNFPRVKGANPIERSANLLCGYIFAKSSMESNEIEPRRGAC